MRIEDTETVLSGFCEDVLCKMERAILQKY